MTSGAFGHAFTALVHVDHAAAIAEDRSLVVHLVTTVHVDEVAIVGAEYLGLALPTQTERSSLL